MPTELELPPKKPRHLSLEALRVAAFGSYAKLAQQLDMSERGYRDWETGRRLPDVEDIARLVEIFGLNRADAWRLCLGILKKHQKWRARQQPKTPPAQPEFQPSTLAISAGLWGTDAAGLGPPERTPHAGDSRTPAAGIGLGPRGR